MYFDPYFSSWVYIGIFTLSYILIIIIKSTDLNISCLYCIWTAKQIEYSAIQSFNLNISPHEMDHLYFL